MKRVTKFLTIVLLAISALGFSACEKVTFSLKQQEDARDPNFLWSENIIIGLSESGARRKKLVIPAYCDGFLGPLFMTGEEATREISFESDKEFPLNGQFTGIEQLKKVELPDGQTTIQDQEFYGCKSLETFHVPGAVVEIGNSAFKDAASLKTVSFGGDAVKTIEKGAFQYCGALSELSFPDSVELIADKAFYQCGSLASVTLPESLRSVGEYAFADSGLVELYIPKNTVLEEYYSTSFSQKHQLTVYVVSGSWADENFEVIFDNTYIKAYWEGNLNEKEQ